MDDVADLRAASAASLAGATLGQARLHRAALIYAVVLRNLPWEPFSWLHVAEVG
ncbi:hypothetical protein AB0J74_27320 [Asanoa sp. NPDC049573]|uniref:hypothetical protein n=1 Tax=Asanoa sp. NPDC049573 TaxID=3155396 RepID=UPI003443BD38